MAIAIAKLAEAKNSADTATEPEIKSSEPEHAECERWWMCESCTKTQLDKLAIAPSTEATECPCLHCPEEDDIIYRLLQICHPKAVILKK